MASFKKPKLELILRWIVGGVFVLASFHKIVDPARFAEVVYGYQILPAEAVNFFAVVLPFVELVTGVFLITGIYPGSAATVATLMLGVFITALSVNLIRGLTFDCGCFSFSESADRFSAWQLLIRDALLLFFALYVAAYREPRLLSPRRS